MNFTSHLFRAGLSDCARRLVLGTAALTLTSQLQAQSEFGDPTYEWDIELISMDLNATTLLPLGPGWGPILTQVHIGESSSLASAGKAFAFDRFPNGENDKIKFTLVAHTVGDANRTFVILRDGTVIDSFDSIADLSGAVVDESQDPPFGPISLTGPTTATSRLVVQTPDAGSTLLLFGGGLALLHCMQRRRNVQA